MKLEDVCIIEDSDGNRPIFSEEEWEKIKRVQPRKVGESHVIPWDNVHVGHAVTTPMCEKIRAKYIEHCFR